PFRLRLCGRFPFVAQARFRGGRIGPRDRRPEGPQAESLKLPRFHFRVKPLTFWLKAFLLPAIGKSFPRWFSLLSLNPVEQFIVPGFKNSQRNRNAFTVDGINLNFFHIVGLLFS